MPKVYNKRDKNIPPDAVYVGRPTKWGNPFVIGKYGDRDEVIRKYRSYILDRYLDEKDPIAREMVELTGRDLVCWCSPKPCHADVLLEIANS